jgi:hypothetical protein
MDLEYIKTTWEYLVNTGTNADITGFVLNNILALAIFVKITPWAWDNALFEWIKGKVAGDKSPVDKY